MRKQRKPAVRGMTGQDARRLRDAIERLDMAARGRADRRYRSAIGHAAPTPGTTKITKAQQATYDRFLESELEKRRPERQWLQRKLARLRRYLDRRSADVEASRARSDLDEALEDLDPQTPPNLPVYLLLIPGLTFLGFAIGGTLGGL